MAKAVTTYCCEVCRMQFQTEQEAGECERSHIRAVGIGWQSFHDGPIAGRYPETLEAKMDDGTTSVYKRSGRNDG